MFELNNWTNSELGFVCRRIHWNMTSVLLFEALDYSESSQVTSVAEFVFLFS